MIPVSQRFSAANKLHSIALQQLEAGDVEGAVKTLEDITARFPDYGRAWYELASILLHHLGDAENAIEYYKKAMESDSGYAPAYLGYAEALFTLERFAEVNAVLNQVMEIKGVQKDVALFRNAMLLESQARFDEAINMYQNSILASFSHNEIARSEQGINRCVLKKKYSR